MLSLFFIPDKQRVRIAEIICVETTSLITKMNISAGHAEMLLLLKKNVPRSLNAQASLTVGDLRKIKLFSVVER